VNYERKKTGTSQKQIKSAVKKAGNSRKAVEKQLSRKNSK
jgi:hypothetical protein